MGGNIFLLLPDWVNDTFLTCINTIRHIPFAGKGRHCPVCGKDSKRFASFGNPPRDDAQCMYCGALERHRFFWLYLTRFLGQMDNRSRKFLHVAPELCFQSKLRHLFRGGYITGDLLSPRARVKMDITNIQFPDGYFDVIYCSHVLEHVQDDRKALKEFNRVLAQDGRAFLMVPICGDKTIEDTSVSDPAERLRLFGQEDHVRIYGSDYIDRLREAGFVVSVETISDLFSEHEINWMGLSEASGDIYSCTK